MLVSIESNKPMAERRVLRKMKLDGTGMDSNYESRESFGERRI